MPLLLVNNGVDGPAGDMPTIGPLAPLTFPNYNDPRTLASIVRAELFEGGSDGVTITNGNSTYSAMDGTPTFSKDKHHTGFLSQKMVSAAGGVQAAGEWRNLGALTTPLYFRGYWNIDNTPPGTSMFMQFSDSTGTLCSRINLKSNSTVEVRNTANTAVGSTTVTYKYSQWTRIEVAILPDPANTSSGYVDLRLYNNSEVPFDQWTDRVFVPNMNTNRTIDRCIVGWSATGQAPSDGVIWYVDDVALSSQGWIGPNADIPYVAAPDPGAKPLSFFLPDLAPFSFPAITPPQPPYVGDVYEPPIPAVMSLTPSATETTDFVDPSTVVMNLTPAATVESKDSLDADIATVLLQPTGFEPIVYTDADTATIVLTPDVFATLDAATATINIVVNSVDIFSAVDDSSLVLSGGFIGAVLNLLPSGVEKPVASSDHATVLVKLNPIFGFSQTETFQAVDANTVVLNLSPSSIFEGIVWHNYLVNGVLAGNRWTAVLTTRKWSGVLAQKVTVGTPPYERWSWIFKGRGDM